MAITLHDVGKEFARRQRRHRPLYREVMRVLRGQSATDRTAALDGISLEVPPGSRVALVGPNGAGKSTLLRIIAGIIEPSRGSVGVRGRVSCFFEVGAGAAPALRLEDNIWLYGALVGLTRNEIARCMDDILDFAELSEHRDARVEQLSFGMAQRLFLAIMAHTMKLEKADLFLFDEWFAGVDQRFKEKGEELIESLPLGHRTVIYASHDLELLARLCTTAIYLRDGRVRMFGATAAVLERYRADARAHA